MQDNSIDIKLIQDTLNGSEIAFENLYRRYSKYHLLTCLRYLKHRFDSEDALQESYIKIYNDFNKFDVNKGSFNAWSTRIVINTCLQQLRKNKSGIEFIDIQDIASDIMIDSDALQQINLKDLTKIISNLPNGYRTIFNMFIIDGYSHKEIAEKLNISISTSKSQLLRAKKQLKKNLINNRHEAIGIYA